jgi:hypothetical protein
MKSRDGKSQRREENKKENQKEKVSEERRSMFAKRSESRETLRFSNDLWLRSRQADRQTEIKVRVLVTTPCLSVD